MAEKKVINKIGQSVNVKIGNNTYSSQNILNIKQANEIAKKPSSITGNENAPRNIANKSVDNLSNTIKTHNTKSPLSITKQTINISKSSSNTSSLQKSGVDSGYAAKNSISSPPLKRSSLNIKQANEIAKKPSPITGNENAPRNITNKSVDNLSNTIKTYNTKSPLSIANQTINKINPNNPKSGSNGGVTGGSGLSSLNLKGVSLNGNNVNQPNNSIKTIINNKPAASGYKKPNSSMVGIATKVKNKFKNELNNIDDGGTKTIATAIVAADMTVKSLKTAQKISQKVVEPYVRGTYNIVRTTSKIVNGIRNGEIKRNLNGTITHNMDSLIAINKLVNSKSMQNCIKINNGIKTGINKTAKYSIIVGNGTVKTVNIARGILNGTVKLKITKDTLNGLKNNAIKGIKLGGTFAGYSIKTGLKTGVKTGKFTRTIFNKPLRYGINSIGSGAMNVLENSDDMGVQAVNLGIKTAKYTVKGIKSTPKVLTKSIKGIKTVVGVPIKTTKALFWGGKGVAGAVKMASQFGIKTTISFYRNKGYKLVAKAGGSVVSAIMNMFKKVGSKFILPLIVIIIVITILTNLMNAPVSAISSLFGGFVTDQTTNKDIDEHEWLLTQINDRRTSFVEDIKNTYNNNLVANGGQYHIVRLFNMFNNKEIELTDTNILNSIYSSTQYVEIIEPIFHTIMLSKYGLEPTTAQMNSLFNEIWGKITTTKTEELPMEYCGSVHSCGIIHANISTCPNYTSGTHTVYTCNYCCYHYYTCNGHKRLICTKQEHKHWDGCYTPDYRRELSCTKEEHKHSDSCYTTDYCSNGERMSYDCGNSTQHDACNGYYQCNGHKILALTISANGFDDLLNTYYINDINTLEGYSNRTDEENEKLQKLKDDYDFCLAYVENLQGEMGNASGNGGVVEISDVTLTKVTELACRYVGNRYIYGGTDINNGIDCSAFVQYVWSQYEVTLPRTTMQQVKCGESVSNINEAKAGDLIFYSDDGTDDGTYHVTMYLGNGKMVHASNSKPYPAGGIKVSNVYGPIYKIRRVAK